jgi:CheY-like chemotaxis protein
MTAELVSVQVAIRQLVDAQQDLVDALRFEFDQTRPVLRTVRVGELLDRVCKSNRGLAGNIDLRAAHSVLTVVSDERWVERILNNLIANAVWHSDGDKIFLCARRRGGDIVFDVRDNGRGMSPEKVAVVFEPIKAPALSSIGYPAARSGLGLYNVRLFTARLGGHVSCDSAPGRGTTFRVRLPGPVGVIERRSFGLNHAVAEAARNKMLVVLDDDLSVLRTTERVFERLGIEVYADHDPLRWLSVVTDLKRMPDLFLLDFQLKGQDCLLQLDIVRRKWGEQRPKIIVISGHSRNQNVLRVAERVPVLQKPLSDQDFDFVLGVLAGQCELPESGFLGGHPWK